MNQSFNAILNTGESSKRRYFRNRSGHHLPGTIALFDRGPGINFSAFDRECDFLFLFIDAEYLHFDFLANLEDFTGMIHTAPGKLADVDQPVCASQVNKSAKVGKITDHATANFAWFQLIKQLFAPP